MEERIQNEIKKGTTTVGIVCKEGLVLAADKRASAGYLLAHKKMEKIVQITENMAITTAGLVSDVQLITKLIKAELRIKRIRTGKEPTTKEAANLLATIVYSNIRKFSTIPGIVGFLLAGLDHNGLKLYEIGADGSVIPREDYCADGSGSEVAYGALETLYNKNLTIDEGIKLAVKSINAAIQRNIATGDGIDVVTVTKKGVKKVLTKEIDTKIAV